MVHWCIDDKGELRIKNNSIVHFQSTEDKRTLDTLLDKRVKELKEYFSDNEADYTDGVYAIGVCLYDEVSPVLDVIS